MTMTEDFKKMIIKEIKKTDRYRLKKKEIGKITSVRIYFVNNKVIRADDSSYCEKTEFQININHKFDCTLNIYTDGTVELFD